MRYKTREELYEILRNGKEVEEAIKELEERDIIAKSNAIRAAIPAICSRNLSHGLGDHIE